MNSNLEKDSAKPFLKWAGGKKALLPELLKRIPEQYSRYFEPFLGSGVLFFAINPEKAYLSDLNKELINTYQQLKQNVNDIIKLLKSMEYNKEFYYQIRSQNLKDAKLRAARFIYLNRTCWNGLYRVNAKGQFNVPIGRYTNPLICDEENLSLVSKILKRTHICAVDFKSSLQKGVKNDFVYFDPPYTTSHKNNGFIEYNSKIFSLEDQYNLCELMEKLDKKGCKIMMSNADHPTIRRCYKKFNISVVSRMSLISGNIKERKEVAELIITNY